MGPKLFIGVLVLTLSGANSDLALMCAASCMSSAFGGSIAHHHHQMDSEPSPPSISQQRAVHEKDAVCAECPPKSGNSLNQKADCASLVQIQALKEGSFSLDAPSGIAEFGAAGTLPYTVGLAYDVERSLVFDASRTIRSSSSALVPLRI